MSTGVQTGTAAAPSELALPQRKQRSEFSRAFTRFRRFKPGVVALVYLLLLSVVAIVPGIFEPYSYQATEPANRLAAPSWDHPMGTDDIGRDILSRVIRGTRVAFIVALAATAIALTIGITVGAVAGYFGGWIDSVLSRLVDSLMAFPTIVLLLTLAQVVGPGIATTVGVIGGTVWAQYARVVRAEFLSARERDFVLAARAAGASSSRIILRHILPNILGPIVVISSLAIGGIIIFEATLSFLGLGVQPPTPSWGSMLAAARPYIENYPHTPLAPGLMIFLTVLAFNLLGDGLRDALDPRQRE